MKAAVLRAVSQDGPPSVVPAAGGRAGRQAGYPRVAAPGRQFCSQEAESIGRHKGRQRLLEFILRAFSVHQDVHTAGFS